MEQTETKEITESNIQKILDFAYEKAVNGVAGLDSAQKMAEEYMSKDGTIENKVNSLIRWQNTKAGTSGFITGLPGIIAMPVTLPANITSVLYVQIRMIAAIAHMGGHDLRDDKVRTFIYLCLAGNAVKDVTKNVGIKIGEKFAIKAVEKISGSTILNINKAVGFRLLTKLGEKGCINLGKAVPFLGGIIGCAFDSISTNIIGNVARTMFIAEISNFESEEIVTPEPILIAKIVALINLMKIDGVKHDLELSFMKSMINESFFSDLTKTNLLTNLISEELAPVNYDIFKENKQDALNLMIDLIALAKKDGTVHIAEGQFIRQIAEKLDFSHDELNSLM